MVSSRMPLVTLTGGDAELTEDRARLCALELDLECGAPVRRLGREQIGHLDAGRGRDRLQQRELRLALAVLDQAQLAAGDPDELAELVEGEAAARRGGDGCGDREWRARGASVGIP